MNKDSKILVAGAKGMTGSAIVRKLKKEGYTNVIEGTRKQVDFTKQQETSFYFSSIEPEYVFLSAAKVGGIMGNKKYPANFIYDNLMIQSNIIDSSYKCGVKKLLFLGSSCIYPKFANQPITEDQLLTGVLEPTNDSYAVAKIAGIKMCQAYREQYGFNSICLMPTNLYGPHDNYDPESSHVIPGLINRFHTAKNLNHSSVKCWGDGTPCREFMYVDDLADACVHLMNIYDSPDIINVGTGLDISIKDLAEKISKIVGYNGEIIWDNLIPNGTPRKLLNVDKIRDQKWKYSIGLDEGLLITYQWYVSSLK